MYIMCVGRNSMNGKTTGQRLFSKIYGYNVCHWFIRKYYLYVKIYILLNKLTIKDSGKSVLFDKTQYII